MNNNTLLRVLKVRSFLFLWLSELFSQIASNMMNFMLIIVAYQITASSTAVSGIVLSFTLPSILFGFFAGVFVDQWNKKKVLFITNVLRAFLVGVLGFVHNSLAVLYILSFCISGVTQFFIPAETPIIPNVVPESLLLPANALFGIALYGSILVAYALSGPFLIALGASTGLLVLSGLFLFAAGFVFFVHTSPTQSFAATPNHHKNRLSLSFEFKQVFSIVIKTKEISQSFFLLTLSQILILVISVIGPGYAQKIVGIKVSEFPLFFVTPAAIGMVVGAVLITNYFHRLSKQKSASIGLFISAIVLLLLPFGDKVTSRAIVHTINLSLPHLFQITILHFMVVLAFIMGVANALIFVPSNTLIQEKTTDAIRGKIYSTLYAVVALFSLIPVIVAGSLADLFGVTSVLVTLGFIIGVVSVYRIIKEYL